MGVYKEKEISKWGGFLLLGFAFLILFEPWFLGMRELFRQEGLYAVQAAELNFNSLSAITAHGVAIRNAYPLFPVLAALFQRITGLEMELALRGISIIMIAATALIVYLAAASNRSSRAGFAACAMYLGSNLLLEKGIDGYPATTCAFLLLSAQLVFFHFGIRKANWSKGWIVSSILIALGFLAGGFWAVLLFIFPMFFFRRPMSVSSKFKKIGFPVGVAIVVVTMLFRLLPYWTLSRGVALESVWWNEISFGEYLLKLASFPVELAARLMPWTVIAWIPFCVALQALDSTPIFSRYLRTLTFATLGLLWILPETDPRELIYLLGPLSILVGINYELAMRRYGHKIRKLLILCEYFAVGTAIAIGVACFAPDWVLDKFMSLSLSSGFSDAATYRMLAAGAATLLLFLAFFFHQGRKVFPVWLMLLGVSVVTGIFFWTVLHPYRAQEREKREFGEKIKKTLAGEPVVRLYKSDILGRLYAELYYSGFPIRKLSAQEQLPENEKVVYLLSSEFPQRSDRNWSNLLPNFSYRHHRLGIWKGELRSGENSLSGESAKSETATGAAN